MTINQILPYLTGGGGALAALTLGWLALLRGQLMTGSSHREIVSGKNAEISARDLMIADKDRQIATLNVALSRERERGDAVILAAHVTREALEGVRKAVTS